MNGEVKNPVDKTREIKKMLSIATIELRAAGINFFSPEPLLEDSFFHCQTSITKAFSAFLMFNGIDFDKNDGFKKLAELCRAADADLAELCAQILNMREHPRNTTFKTDEEELKTVIITAEKTFQKVIEKMPLEFFKK
jgi:uncharacterized protein (UPF0332 family)